MFASAATAGMHTHETAANPTESANASAQASAEETAADVFGGGWTAARNDKVDDLVLNTETTGT